MPSRHRPPELWAVEAVAAAVVAAVVLLLLCHCCCCCATAAAGGVPPLRPSPAQLLWHLRQGAAGHVWATWLTWLLLGTANVRPSN
jgi:hypothetical protein